MKLKYYIPYGIEEFLQSLEMSDIRSSFPTMQLLIQVMEFVQAI